MYVWVCICLILQFCLSYRLPVISSQSLDRIASALPQITIEKLPNIKLTQKTVHHFDSIPIFFSFRLFSVNYLSTMAYRKVIESEIGRYEKLGTRLETNLKNMTQTLVTDRNNYKSQHDDKDKQLSELKTQNVELKAINNCWDQNKKLYEAMAFKTHDQNYIATIMEAATNYAGNRGSEAGSEHQTPRRSDSSFNIPPAAAMVNVDDEDEHNGSRTSNHETISLCE